MKSSTTSSLFLAAAIAGGLATTFLASSALADDITVDNTRFVSSKSRDEVRADLKTPYPGGYPWSSQYKMGVTKSDRTRQEAIREYLSYRDDVDALGAEDSGSNYFKRTAARANPAAAMGGPAR
jgi:hypothetical protein